MKRARRISALFLTSWLLVLNSFAFDTGPHSDLTRAVLADHGFSEDGIKAVQVENWLTDYYSNSPTYSKDRRAVFEKLHFDNLFTAAQVDNYWATLTNNLKNAAQKAARDQDKMAMLVVMGVGLHAVQDFYAHSNWVETHPRTDAAAYRSDTYLGSLSSSPRPVIKGLHTGKYPADRTQGPGVDSPPANADLHGDYYTGLNHDSPIRPRWDEAYVFAYCATQELVTAFERWSDEASPGFWKSVQAFALDAAVRKRLDHDISAARNISMWFKGEGQDGHWKGDRSGTARFFSAYSSKWVSGDSSDFVKTLRDGHIQDALAADLYSGKTPPRLPAFDRYSSRKRMILFRAAQITESKSGGIVGKVPSVDTPDYYARTTINGQEFWGRTIQHSRDVTDPWMEICFVDQSLASIPIEISVFDEDSLDNDRDHPIDINPAPGKQRIDAMLRVSDSTLSGDLTGVFNSPTIPFTTGGAKPDDHRAVLSGFITSLTIR